MKELEKVGQDNENLEAIHNNYNSIKGFFEYIMTIYDTHMKYKIKRNINRGQIHSLDILRFNAIDFSSTASLL
jgi:hypothetical protein